MGKTIVTEYNLTNSILHNKTTIATFGDVHGEYEKLERFRNLIKELKVAIALIPGDTLESVIGSDYSRERVIELLQEISKFATVVYTHGNHDTVYVDAEPEENRERLLENNYRLWNRLKETENVIIPELPYDGVTTIKSSLTDDIDVSVISITPEYYWFKEQLYYYDKYIMALEDLELSKDKFNILLAHSPKHIVRGSHIDENVKGFNLVVSGHMHSGMIPHCLKNNHLRRGLLGPGKSVFPANSYGVVKDGETISIITGGATKVGDASFGAPLKKLPGAKPILERVYSPEMEIINLVPGNEAKISKVKSYKI